MFQQIEEYLARQLDFNIDRYISKKIHTYIRVYRKTYVINIQLGINKQVFKRQ